MISFLLYTHGMNDALIAAHYSHYSSAKTTFRIRSLRIFFSHTVINLQSGRGTSHHRVHRVATAAFWRTFSDEGKISPGC